MRREAYAILSIAYRDFLKLVRDPARIASTFIFPLLFIGILGGSMQSNLGADAGYDLLTFIFTGVLGQTVFASTASGVISLIEDRENDFSQEVFVSPISRYSIVFGKILGESLVALPQGAAIIVFGLLFGADVSWARLALMAPVGLIICLFGGAFGLLVLSNLTSQRAANQVFPFIMFPQFFLAGVFGPIKVLPWYLEALSRIAPMRYAVDLLRSIYYFDTPSYDKIVLASPVYNLAVIGGMFALFMVVGTFLFVRGEHNR
jgi:ABC-2 type transport system permease protein